jgi:hypothetical protein
MREHPVNSGNVQEIGANPLGTARQAQIPEFSQEQNPKQQQRSEQKLNRPKQEFDAGKYSHYCLGLIAAG